MSSTSSLNNGGKTTVGTIPKRLASPVSHKTPSNSSADMITQRPKGVDRGRDGQYSALPFGSETLDTAESDVREKVSSEAWSITTLPTLHQRNSSQVPEPGNDTRNPTEIPGISVQTANSITSDTSSFTIVGGLSERRPTKANHRTHDGMDGQETDGMRDSRGATNTRSNQGDGGAKKPKKPESQQQKSSGRKLGRTSQYDRSLRVS